MELKQIHELAKSWIKNEGKYCEAWEKLEELVSDEPLIALRVIEEILHILFNNEVVDLKLVGNLGAGALEELLDQHQESIIDDIEELASSDENFRKCLTAVWKNTMSDEIYGRVQKEAESNFKL